MTEDGDLGDKGFFISGFLNGVKNLPCESNLCSKTPYLHVSSLYLFEGKTAKLKNPITSPQHSRMENKQEMGCKNSRASVRHIIFSSCCRLLKTEF